MHHRLDSQLDEALKQIDVEGCQSAGGRIEYVGMFGMPSCIICPSRTQVRFVKIPRSAKADALYTSAMMTLCHNPAKQDMESALQIIRHMVAGGK